MAGFRMPQASTAFALDPSDKAQGRIEDKAHLAFIRTLPSVLSGSLGCDPCHIRYGDPVYRKKRTGKGQKPDDAWTVPMTRAEHDDQHANNEAAWWRQRGIDPLAIAQKLYEVSGNREAALEILRKVQ